jgi:hypothetical protein
LDQDFSKQPFFGGQIDGGSSRRTIASQLKGPRRESLECLADVFSDVSHPMHASIGLYFQI